jgi:hypothetical protein
MIAKICWWRLFRHFITTVGTFSHTRARIFKVQRARHITVIPWEDEVGRGRKHIPRGMRRYDGYRSE